MTFTERRCLILGDEGDPHIARVSSALRSTRCVVDVADIWRPWTPLTYAFDGGGSTLQRDGQTLDYSGVWWRLKPRLSGTLSEAEMFAVRERSEFLNGCLWAIRSHASVVNDPWAQDRSRNKPYQLQRAREVGFSVPRTWVTSDASFVVQRARDLGNVIYKPLSWLSSIDGRLLFTNTLDAEELTAHAAAIGRAPGIYQEVVPKRYEYRVTIIDEEMYAVRIFSQEREDTALDWRRNQTDVRYERCDMDGAVEGRLRQLMKILGLRYAALDLIETPDDCLVFLEANPGGNWLWLEDRVGIPVSAALAAALSKT